MTMERKKIHALRMNSETETRHDSTLLDSSLPWESDCGRTYRHLWKWGLGLLCCAELLEIPMRTTVTRRVWRILWHSFNGTRSSIHELIPTGNDCNKAQQTLKWERSPHLLKCQHPVDIKPLCLRRRKDELECFYSGYKALSCLL